MKNIRVFYLKIFNFLEVKVSIYLNRRVFVMNVHSQPCNASFNGDISALSRLDIYSLTFCKC